MSAATITNFILPTSQVVTWAVNRLKTDSSWNVYRYPKIDYNEIFKYILNLRSPFAVVVYTGSSYDDENQRRTGTLVVICGIKNFTDAEQAATDAQALLDKSISLIDHEIYGDLFAKVRYDKPVDFKNSGMVAYESGFKFEDH